MMAGMSDVHSLEASRPDEAARHLLVVDDDKRLRDLLRSFLKDHGYVVTAAASAAEARELLGLFHADLIVLDVMMKGESGLEFLAWLRGARIDVPVLMLTARGEALDRIAGFEAGADDYLPKPFEPRELLLRLAAILRRQKPERPERTLRLGPWRFDVELGELSDGDKTVRLSSVEAGLLRTLALKPNQIVSREDLVAGQPLATNARTVDVQVTRLRRKIESDPKNPRTLLTVRGEGYMLRTEAQGA